MTRRWSDRLRESLIDLGIALALLSLFAPFLLNLADSSEPVQVYVVGSGGGE